MIQNRVRASLRAFAIHISISVLVAIVAAVVVFLLWYPRPYAEFLGGGKLFMLIVIVDVICGPLLTLVLFNPSKPKKELALDLSLVVAVQLAALGYGLYTMALARPIYLAYELDRFRVVSHADLEPGALATKPTSIPAPGWLGLQLIAVKVAKPDDADYLAEVELSVNGTETVYRPNRWVLFDTQKELVIQKANSIELLKKKHLEKSDFIDRQLKDLGLKANATLWLPMQSRRGTGWVVLIHSNTGLIAGYLPLDGF